MSDRAKHWYGGIRNTLGPVVTVCFSNRASDETTLTFYLAPLTLNVDCVYM